MAANTCMGDCLAFLFGGDGEEIQKYLNGDGLAKFSWWGRLTDLCAANGVKYTFLSWYENDEERPFPLAEVPEGRHIAIGVSPRGGRHAIIVGDGQMIYDPHEGGEGLVEIDYLVTFDPIGTVV